MRGVPAAEVVAFLDREWEQGTVHLRKALWGRFGSRVCKIDGTTTPRAKGSGASGERTNVEGKLAKMAGFPTFRFCWSRFGSPVCYTHMRGRTTSPNNAVEVRSVSLKLLSRKDSGG